MPGLLRRKLTRASREPASHANAETNLRQRRRPSTAALVFSRHCLRSTIQKSGAMRNPIARKHRSSVPHLIMCKHRVVEICGRPKAMPVLRSPRSPTAPCSLSFAAEILTLTPSSLRVYGMAPSLECPVSNAFTFRSIVGVVGVV